MTARNLGTLACTLVIGCGGIGDRSYTPPLMTVHGTIRQIAIDHVPQNVHVAVVWEGSTADGHLIDTAEDVAVESSFPATFSVNVTAIPQTLQRCDANDCARLGLPDNAQWGRGELIVYEDLNGNGRLDTVAEGAVTPSPDRVIGRSEGTTLWYLDGTIAPAGASTGPSGPDLSTFPIPDGGASGNRPTYPGESFVGFAPVVHGFSVTTSTPNAPTFDGCANDVATCSGDFPASVQLVALPAAIDLQLESDSPNLKQYTCNSSFGAGPYDVVGNLDVASRGRLCGDPSTCFCQENNFDDPTALAACPHDLPPAGTTATCSADGKQYLYTACFADPANCYTPFCHWGYGALAAGETAPANWPCIVH